MLGGCETLRLSAAPTPPPVEPPPAPAAEPAAITPPPRVAPLPARKPSPQQPAAVAAPPTGSEPLPRPPVVIGLNRDGLIENFGLPVAEREAAPARVIEFGDGECRLAAYLYFDTARNDFYVLQYEVNGLPAPHDAVDRCLSRIARDASRR